MDSLTRGGLGWGKIIFDSRIETEINKFPDRSRKEQYKGGIVVSTSLNHRNQYWIGKPTLYRRVSVGSSLDQNYY
jgi:hypothetical protein